MSDVRPLVEAAFRLHANGVLSRDGLVQILEQLANSVAIENGYADTIGLPFPKDPREVPNAP